MAAHETSQQTLAAPAPPALRSAALQRQCACGQHTGGAGACESCRPQREGLLQRQAVGGGPLVAPSIVRDVLQTPGRPLDAATRRLMEPRFGHDFSRVRLRASDQQPRRSALRINPPGDHYEQEAERIADQVVQAQAVDDPASRAPDFGQVRIHTDARAAESARAVGARAYTVGQSIVFGAGQYQPATSAGQRLLAHELTHVVQQGTTGALVQRAPIDEVRERLSYSLTDWAITDTDAMIALTLLGRIDPAALPGELQKLGTKYVMRLLDNLPDAAKTGEIYKRVIEALGPTGITGYAVDQLSYGLFDLAITDAEVTRVFNTFENLPVAQREQFLANLQAAQRLGRLIDNANEGHHSLYIRPWLQTLTRGALTQRQRTIVRTIVAESDNDSFETIKLATELRFDVTVGPSKNPNHPAVSWEPTSLRKTYLTLDELPDAHVGKNKELRHLGQFEEPSKDGLTTAGVYTASRRELAVNTKAGDVQGTLIHETGHAVDQEMGWSAGPEPAKPARGGWKDYGAGYKDCAHEMTEDSGGGIKTDITAAQRTDVENEMATSMTSRSAAGLEQRIRGLAWFGALKAAVKGSIIDDRALTALGTGLNVPWFRATDGGEHLSTHVYQESYPSTWVRYEHQARARMVSEYQFRDSGEWFAEAYEAYYTPDKRGRGAKLNDKDPDTKRYFDTDVNTRAPSR